MERLLGSDAERRRWSEAGKQQAARFTWARCADETLAAYEQVLVTRPGEPSPRASSSV
jgi:hypothetical protein